MVQYHISILLGVTVLCSNHTIDYRISQYSIKVENQVQKLYEMQPLEKESKRQHRIEEENKQLVEAAKKKEKWQLEEIRRLEQASSKKLEKEKRLECQHAMEINHFEQIANRKIGKRKETRV